MVEGFSNEPVRNFVFPAALAHIWRDPAYGLWIGMIILKEDCLAFGSMGFKAPPDGQGTVEIGYDIAG